MSINIFKPIRLGRLTELLISFYDENVRTMAYYRLSPIAVCLPDLLPTLGVYGTTSINYSFTIGSDWTRQIGSTIDPLLSTRRTFEILLYTFEKLRPVGGNPSTSSMDNQLAALNASNTITLPAVEKIHRRFFKITPPVPLASWHSIGVVKLLTG